MRNRILAALCEVVVVVESRERGGSLGTATEALARSVEVMAVPGSPRSRASAGTNALLQDGAAPVTSALDVALALGLDTRRLSGRAVDTRPVPIGLAAMVLEHCREGSATLDALVGATGEPVGSVAMALARLERDGWIAEADGWFEALRSRAAVR
jgi:DNA processing protein